MSRALRTTGHALLTAALIAAPLAAPAFAQTQHQVLAGTTEGLRWVLHAPGHLINVGQGNGELHLAAPPRSNVTGAKYNENEKSAVLVYRAERSFREAFEHHDQQLRNQGFNRSSMNVTDDRAEAQYTRQNSRVTLRMTIDNREKRAYRAVLDLTDVRRDQSGSNASTGTDQTNNNQAGGNQSGARPFATINRDNVTYLLYGATTLNDLSINASQVRMGAPGNATNVVSVSQDNESVAWKFDSQQDLTSIFNHYDNQLKRQGYAVNLTSINQQNNTARGVYTRNNNRIGLQVNRQGNATYNVMLDFTPDSN